MADASDERPMLDELSVGDEGPTVVIEDVSRSDFVRYAGASGDFNPIHYDEPYAEAAGNPSVFGQGMLTAGFAAHLATKWFGLEPIRRFETRFLNRVWPGDDLTVTGEVTAVEDSTVTASLTVTNGDDSAVISGEVVADLSQHHG